MFKRVRDFFGRLFRITKAVGDIGEAASSVKDIASQRNIASAVGATIKAANDVSEAGGSMQDAAKQ